MRVLRGSYTTWAQPEGRAAATIGVFDGVHLGHRRLLERAFEHDGVPTVVTFDPHPVEVLAPGTDPRLITTIEERLSLFEEVGVETAAVLDLTEVRYFSPTQFVDQILVDRLAVTALTVGSDYHFGKDRAGDVAFLSEAGRDRGFPCTVVDLVSEGGQVVSSTRIRALIEAGSVFDASELLGSRFQMTNTVIHGDKRGREMGYPTANLLPVAGKVLPGDGVYATIVTTNGLPLMAATNVGTRPTFGGGERLVEAHILDFDENIYGEEMTVEFVDRLRPELKFASVDELLANMADDVAATRRILDPVMG